MAAAPDPAWDVRNIIRLRRHLM